MEWEKSKNLDETQFVEYLLKITKKPSTAESKPIITSSSTTSYEVTGLESETLYDKTFSFAFLRVATYRLQPCAQGRGRPMPMSAL